MKQIKSMTYNLRPKFGFTLIELLVVIAIIAILISVGSVSYTRSLKLSRDSKRKTDLEQIRQALETYRAETGAYPDDATYTTALEPTYISDIPQDPKEDASTYTYKYNRITTISYKICANLEVPPSAATYTKPTVCDATKNYGVVQP